MAGLGFMDTITSGLGNMFGMGADTQMHIGANAAGEMITSPSAFEGSTLGSTNGVITEGLDVSKYNQSTIDGLTSNAGKSGFDINKTLGTLGTLGNGYMAIKDQQMKEKQFDSNEAFKKWMQNKEEERSAGAKSLGRELAQ